VAHPLKKSSRKREEPKLGEPKLVHPESDSEITIAQELQGESVSDTLVRARQQLGQDLRSIAQVLCIRFSYLDAIERGQYENLPGATYAVGFVRTYAEYLGLDGEQVVERFKTEVEGLDNQTKLHFPTPAPEGKMPGGAVFLVAALLFAGAYGVWFYLSNQGESLTDLVAPVPEHLQGLVDSDQLAAPVEPPAPAPGVETGAAVEAMPAAPVVETPPPSLAEAAPQTPAVPESATQPPATPIEPDVAATEPETAVTPPPAPTASASVMAAPSTAPAVDSTPPLAPASPVLQAETPQPAMAPLAAEQDQPATVAETPAVPSLAESGASEVVDSAPAAASPSQGDPFAIPAAPDSADAASFLVNHEPRVYGEENTGARIVLKANQDAWVQVRDRQGTLLLTRVLRVGDSYMVPNQADLTLLTGNAGGLEISVDGRALEPLGPVGAVRRNIPLDPDALAGGAGRRP
jgi:cytoskeleton protein RodZ